MICVSLSPRINYNEEEENFIPERSETVLVCKEYSYRLAPTLSLIVPNKLPKNLEFMLPQAIQVILLLRHVCPINFIYTDPVENLYLSLVTFHYRFAFS